MSLTTINRPVDLPTPVYSFPDNSSFLLYIETVENNEIIVGIFVDLAKAFDIVNHNILLSNLHHYGIRGIPYEWFKSCLNGRSQCVYVNGINSDYLPIKCGVPQGSILGLLLFLKYINDLSSTTNATNVLRCIMFADDTNMFISGKIFYLNHIYN